MPQGLGPSEPGLSVWARPAEWALAILTGPKEQWTQRGPAAEREGIRERETGRGLHCKAMVGEEGVNRGRTEFPQDQCKEGAEAGPDPTSTSPKGLGDAGSQNVGDGFPKSSSGRGEDPG